MMFCLFLGTEAGIMKSFWFHDVSPLPAFWPFLLQSDQFSSSHFGAFDSSPTAPLSSKACRACTAQFEAWSCSSWRSPHHGLPTSLWHARALRHHPQWRPASTKSTKPISGGISRGPYLKQFKRPEANDWKCCVWPWKQYTFKRPTYVLIQIPTHFNFFRPPFFQICPKFYKFETVWHYLG